MATKVKTGGRQKGTPNKTTLEIRELAKNYAEAALNGLVELATNSDNDTVKLRAWCEILDRGYGKASAVVEDDAPESIKQSEYILRPDESIPANTIL